MKYVGENNVSISIADPYPDHFPETASRSDPFQWPFLDYFISFLELLTNTTSDSTKI
jgi:hypothetical protein